MLLICLLFSPGFGKLQNKVYNKYSYLKIWEMIFMVKGEDGRIFPKSNRGCQITKHRDCIPLDNKMILNAIIKNKSYFH